MAGRAAAGGAADGARSAVVEQSTELAEHLQALGGQLDLGAVQRAGGVAAALAGPDSALKAALSAAVDAFIERDPAQHAGSRLRQLIRQHDGATQDMASKVSYLPVSDGAEPLRFTHVAKQQGAAFIDYAGELSKLASGPTATLRQTHTAQCVHHAVCVDTPMRRGVHFAEFTLSGGVEEAQVRELFDVIDSDSDGVLTRRELKARLLDNSDDLKKRVEAAGLSSRKHAIEQLDVNSDGRIEIEEFVEMFSNIEQDPESEEEPRFIFGARTTKPGGFAVAFCPDRGLLQHSETRGKPASRENVSYPDGARVMQSTDRIGIELEFGQNGVTWMRVYHNGVEFGKLGFHIDEEEPLCWTAGVRNPGDTIRVAGLKWRSNEYKAAGSEICVPHHVAMWHHRYDKLHDSSSLSIVRGSDDILVQGGSAAVWNTNLVSDEFSHGTHYAEFVPQEPSASHDGSDRFRHDGSTATGRGWMVGVARPTVDVDAQYSFTRDDIWAYAGGADGGRVNRGKHGQDPTDIALIKQAVAENGSPKCRDLDRQIRRLEAEISKKRKLENEAVVNNNDVEAAKVLQRDGAAAQDTVDALIKERVGEESNDQETLTRWDGLLDQVKKLSSLRAEKAKQGDYDYKLVRPAKPDAEQQVRDEIASMLFNISDQRIAASAQLAGVKQLNIAGYPAAGGEQVNGTYVLYNEEDASEGKWAVYRNDQGPTFLYHHHSAEKWIIHSKYTPHLGDSVASISAAYGCLPVGRMGWQCRIDSQYTRHHLTVTLPSAERVADADVDQEMRLALDQVPTPVASSNWAFGLKTDGSTTTGEITSSSMCKSYQFVASEGVAYTFETKLGSNNDTIMYLVSRDRQHLISSNDDKAEGDHASCIKWECPKKGVYFIVVKGFEGTMGTFKLTATAVDNTVTRSSCLRPENGGFILEGSLAERKPQEAFQVWLCGGCTYLFDAVPDMSRLFGIDGKALIREFTEDETSFTFTCEDSGVYYVVTIAPPQSAMEKRTEFTVGVTHTAGELVGAPRRVWKIHPLESLEAFPDPSSATGYCMSRRCGERGTVASQTLQQLLEQATEEGVDEAKLQKLLISSPIGEAITRLQEEAEAIRRELKPTLDDLASRPGAWDDQVRNACGDGRLLDKWPGMGAAKPGDIIGLLIDLPSDGPANGTLKVYKNGQLLGTMCTGLAGTFCWSVTLCSGESVKRLGEAKYFPQQEPRTAVETRASWNAAVMETQARKAAMHDPTNHVAEGTGHQKVKLSKKEQAATLRAEWLARSIEADDQSHKAKLQQHYFHRPNVSVGASICLQGSQLADKTLNQMQIECQKANRPVGFTFKTNPGDADGKGTGQLLTKLALIDSNNFRVGEQYYGGPTRLSGETVDVKEYALSNKEAMKSAVAHCRLIRAHGFNFFANKEVPDGPVKCFFKRRTAPEGASTAVGGDASAGAGSGTAVGSWSETERLEVQKRLYSPRKTTGSERYRVEGLNPADTLLMEALPSTQRRRFVAAFGRIDSNSNGTITKNELVIGLRAEVDLLQLILPREMIPKFQSGDHAAQMKAFKFIDGDGSRTLGATELIIFMVRAQMSRAQTAEGVLSQKDDEGEWHNYTVRPEEDGVYLWTDLPQGKPPIIVEPKPPRMAEAYGPPTLAQAQKIHPKYDPWSSVPTHWAFHEVVTGKRTDRPAREKTAQRPEKKQPADPTFQKSSSKSGIDWPKKRAQREKPPPKEGGFAEANPAPRYKRKSKNISQLAREDRYDIKPSSWANREALVSEPTKYRFGGSEETGRDGGTYFKEWEDKFQSMPPQKPPAAAHKIPEHLKGVKAEVPPTPRGFGTTCATFRGMQSPFVPWSKQQMSRAMLTEWQQSKQAQIDFSGVRITIAGSTLPLPVYRYEGKPLKDIKWAAFSLKHTEELEEAIFDAIDIGSAGVITRYDCRHSSFGDPLAAYWPELDQDLGRQISQHEWRFYLSAIRRQLGLDYTDFIISIACESILGNEYDLGEEILAMFEKIDVDHSGGIKPSELSKIYEEDEEGIMEHVSEKLEQLMKYVDKPTSHIFEQLDSDLDAEITVRELVGSLTRTRVMELFPDWPNVPSETPKLSKAARSDLLLDGAHSKTFPGTIEHPTSIKGVQKLMNKQATSTCSGEYKYAGMRNGRPCFNRANGKPGALYFDGSYWKLTNEGAARTEVQWNYSQMQNPVSPVPPMGHWRADAAKGGSTEPDYGGLRLKVSAGKQVLGPQSELPTHAPRVAMTNASWKNSEKKEFDKTARVLTSPRNWAYGVPESLTFVTSVDAREGLRPTKVEYSHGMGTVEKLGIKTEKFGFGSHAPTRRGKSGGSSSSQYVNLGDAWYTLTPRDNAPPADERQHHRTLGMKQASVSKSPKRQRPKSAPMGRAALTSPRQSARPMVSWKEEMQAVPDSILQEVALSTPEDFAHTAAKYQVAVPPALTSKIPHKKAATAKAAKPPAVDPPIVSNDEQIVRLKALQEVKHLTDTLERGLHRGQAALQTELKKMQMDQRKDRRSASAAQQIVKADVDGRMQHLQQGWEVHAQTIQRGVDEMKSELIAWGAGTKHMVSGVEESTAAAIKAVEGTHAKILQDRWETMELELARQRSKFEAEMSKLQAQLAKKEEARQQQMKASLNGIAKSLTDGLGGVAEQMKIQQQHPTVNPTPPAAKPVAEKQVRVHPHKVQKKPAEAIGTDATYVAREPWGAGRASSASGMVGATVSPAPDTSSAHTAAALASGIKLDPSPTMMREVAVPTIQSEVDARMPYRPQPPPPAAAVSAQAPAPPPATGGWGAIGKMVGLLKQELGLDASLSVPAAVTEAQTMLEYPAWSEGTSLRKKVQTLCDELGLQVPETPALTKALTAVAGQAAQASTAAQPTVELLNDAVSRLEAMVEYPPKMVPTAVVDPYERIEKHIERVRQYPPLAQAPRVDASIDATNHHPPSDKTQEEMIVLAVAGGVEKALANGLFDVGWQRQEHLTAVKAEMDTVRADAESSVAKEMMKMRMEARDKAQEERERNMRRSFDAVAAQRERALVEREAETAAMAREAALAKREAMLVAIEQRQMAFNQQPAAPASSALPAVAMATPRPPTQPTTPPSEPAEPQGGQVPPPGNSSGGPGPRKQRDMLFEHMNLLKGLKMRGLLDEAEYEKRKASMLDKYTSSMGAQTAR